MNQPVRFLLLSNNIKEQLQKHTHNVLESWVARWGIFKSCSWDIDISSSLAGIDCKKIDAGLKEDGQIFFSISCLRYKHILASEIVQEKIASVSGSKLINSIASDALLDLQNNFIHKENAKNKDIFDASEYPSLAEYVQSSNMAAIKLSTDGFQMILLLSMPLIGTLVEEEGVDYSQPSLEVENLMDAFSDELVNVKVAYGSVDISVEELSTIRAGDVICLDKSISSSMSVSDQYGNHLFSGYLGVKEKNLALKVVEKSELEKKYVSK